MTIIRNDYWENAEDGIYDSAGKALELYGAQEVSDML